MRRLRHLRSPRSGQHDLPRTLRVAAPGPGERRHRRLRYAAGAYLARDGVRRRYFRRRDAVEAAWTDLDRARALFHSRREQAAERAADPDRLRPWPDRAV